MTWPEAFTTVGIAMAVALVVYSICRWGGKVLKNAPYTDVERLRCGDRELVK